MDVLNELLAPTAQKEIQAFIIILKWVDAASRPWPGAAAWPVEIRLAFVWNHARRLHSLFKSLGATDIRIADHFDQAFETLKSALFFPTRNLGILDAAHPMHLDQNNLLLFGFGYALEECWETISSHGEIVQQLADVAFWKGAEKNLNHLPTPSALLDITLASNTFFSFMGNDSLTWLLEKLQTAGGGESSDIWTAQWRTNWRESALMQLEQDPGDQGAWGLLAGIQGHLPLPRDAWLRLISLVEKTDFSVLCRKDPISGSLVLLVATVLVRMTEDTERKTRQCMEGQLSACLDAILSHYNPNKETSGQLVTGSDYRQKVSKIADLAVSNQNEAPENEKALINFFNAVLNIAVITDDPDRSAEHFGRLLSQLCEHRSQVLAPLLRPILQHLVENLPIASGRHLWRPLLILRAV
ncbi:MAG: hypothetical protein HQM05_15750 [Magnetococcales bacterium]|nr:hypothetical protein [Magnetococcales bacterium]